MVAATAFVTSADPAPPPAFVIDELKSKLGAAGPNHFKDTASCDVIAAFLGAVASTLHLMASEWWTPLLEVTQQMLRFAPNTKLTVQLGPALDAAITRFAVEQWPRVDLQKSEWTKDLQEFLRRQLAADAAAVKIKDFVNPEGVPEAALVDALVVRSAPAGEVAVAGEASATSSVEVAPAGLQAEEDADGSNVDMDAKTEEMGPGPSEVAVIEDTYCM